MHKIKHLSIETIKGLIDNNILTYTDYFANYGIDFCDVLYILENN